MGIVGSGDRNFITGNEIFPYLIRFENKASATAAAQTVRIVDTLDTQTLDISTLQLGFFSFNDVVVNVPPGRKNYKAEVDLRPSNDLIVRIEAKLDEGNGTLTWLFSSLDPYTLEPTQNPDAGFLAPNKTAPEGDGGVFYTIRPKPDLVTDEEIKNKAYIYFDNNEVIPTPTWSNSIDKLQPISQIDSLAPIQADSTFMVSWSGSDEGSGISHYSVYVSVNNKPYTLWLNQVTDTFSWFEGYPDSTYHFYSIAMDSIGFVENVPESPDATTTISRITSLEEVVDDQISIYPNPVSQTLTIKMPYYYRNSKITLFDMHGREVINMDAIHTTTNIPINHLAKGVYFVYIYNKSSVIIKKIIVI